jgi:hypothetical protein
VEGEWFLDREEAALYIIPPTGTTVSELSLVPVHRPTAFAVRGNASAPVAHVSLQNVTIMHAAPTYLEPYE